MTAVRDMHCQELVEVITDYLEGALSPEDRRRFEKHLSTCSGCRNYLEQMRATIRATGALKEESIPGGVREQLLQAFRDWRRRRPA
jgi:anti-sigma factor RsiW